MLGSLFAHLLARAIMRQFVRLNCAAAAAASLSFSVGTPSLGSYARRAARPLCTRRKLPRIALSLACRCDSEHAQRASGTYGAVADPVRLTGLKLR